MPRAITLVFLFGFSIALCPACTSWEQLPVKLFNDAAMESNVLEPAKEEAAWLLKSVCVDVTWILCPVVTVVNFAPCAAPTNAAELHILASPLTSEGGENVMGLAMPKAGPRGRAGVFLSRVREAVDSDPGVIGVPRLLGHAMAHEIGHLLLRSSIHSSEGLMRAGFRRPDLKKAAQRRLRFTAEQASTIQQRVLAEAR
jgi:hypothetical protein